MTHPHEFSHHENIEMDFPEGKFDREIELNLPIKKFRIKKENCYELCGTNFLPKQID